MKQGIHREDTKATENRLVHHGGHGEHGVSRGNAATMDTNR